MKDDRLYLHHMLERCQRISRFIQPGREVFFKPEELQDAVVRNIEVIGEAAKRVSDDARTRLGSLDWKAICGMRDVLIHDYIGVDLDEVWNVAFFRIPELKTALEQFLAGTTEDPGSYSLSVSCGNRRANRRKQPLGRGRQKLDFIGVAWPELP